jgi:hypothetical protein
MAAATPELETLVVKTPSEAAETEKGSPGCEKRKVRHAASVAPSTGCGERTQASQRRAPGSAQGPEERERQTGE